MSRASPFHQAASAVRERLRSGRLVLGEQLMVAEVCRELGRSQTPVREALAYLAGEGLIEDRRGTGYFAWRLDAVDLAELYALQDIFVAAALEPGLASAGAFGGEGAGEVQPTGGGASLAEATEQVFAALVRRGRNAALARLNRLLADRLAPARAVEALVLGDLAEEQAALATTRGRLEALRAWSRAYHARRIAHAPAIVAALRSAAAAR